MKDSVLTTRTWVLLIAAALLIAAGLLNFGQRLRNQPPPWDGVTWVDTRDGITAGRIEPNSSGNRALLVPGDRLLAISKDDRKYDVVAEAQDVQIYLEEAHVGGNLHYLIDRPTYPEDSRYYYADLSNLDARQTWVPRDIYLDLLGLIWLFVGLFVIFKQGGRAPFVLHFAALCLAAFVFHFFKPIGTYEDLDLSIAILRNAGFILFGPLFCTSA